MRSFIPSNSSSCMKAVHIPEDVQMNSEYACTSLGPPLLLFFLVISPPYEVGKNQLHFPDGKLRHKEHK